MKRFYLERRAQALVRLAQGITQTQTAQEFHVHLNSVRAWMRGWQTVGLVGLDEEHHKGRPQVVAAVAQKLRQVATEEGGTIGHIMHAWKKIICRSWCNRIQWRAG
jgi:transposase